MVVSQIIIAFLQVDIMSRFQERTIIPVISFETLKNKSSTITFLLLTSKIKKKMNDRNSNSRGFMALF